MAIPEIVVLKDEDEIGGEVVGPVTGYSRAELEEAARSEIGVPYDPDRMQRWVTRSQAVALAAEYGAEFRES